VGVATVRAVSATVPDVRLTCGKLEGSGRKTMTAAFLSCGLARTGRTRLVRVDPFGSLLDWSQAAGPSPATFIAWPVKNLAKRVQAIADDYDNAVIDTWRATSSTACARFADIFCAPSTLSEVERLVETFRLVKEV
jgi:hypothetical protein